jgi:MFS family permease
MMLVVLHHLDYRDNLSMILKRIFGAQTAAVLRPPFLPYLLGQGVSALGDRVTSVALPAVVLSLGGAATDLAMLAAWSSGAQLALLLVGGLLVDRLPRRAVMLTTDVLRAIVLALIAWQLTRGGASITLILVLSTVLGACSAIFYPATASILPQLVDDHELVRANALRNLSNQLSGVIGPALGGLLIAFGGVSLALGLDALSFVVGAFGLFLMRPRVRQSQPRENTSIWTEVSEGFRVILASTWLWLTVVLFAVVNIFMGGMNVIVLPLYVRDVLGATESLGWLYAAQAVGAIIAALLLGRVGRIRHRGVVAYLAVVLEGATLLILGLTASLPLALLAMLLRGAWITVFGVLWEVTLQEHVPNEMLGRVASVDMLGSMALLPVGFVLFGQAVIVLGVTSSVLLSGTVIIALALLGLSTRAVRQLE